MAADFSWIAHASLRPATYRLCPVCSAAMPPPRIMCIRHWAMVPSDIKHRFGDARRSRDRARLAAVKAEAIAYVRELEGRHG